MPGGNQPAVSVVTSTYNRANVLRFTIESLRAQTITDWEMIVIGDACTDETEDLIRSFGDARMRFVNRAVNSGEQATPNNDGVRLARGRYVAFLNHDDLWTPDHLSTSIETIERMQADLVWSVTILIGLDGGSRLAGSQDHYSPEEFIPASSWLMRRELAEQVGPWRLAREIFIAPSQEWLFRAWKKRAVLRPVNAPTVLAISSASRRNAYAERPFDEHEAYLARLSEPGFIADLRSEIELRNSAWKRKLTIVERIRRAIGATMRRLLTTAGFHPHSLFYAVRFRKAGGYLDALRKYRGLPPLPRPGGSE